MGHHPSPGNFAWDFVKLVADGSKDKWYDTSTEETYDIALDGALFDIEGLRSVAVTVTGGPSVSTTLRFHGTVDVREEGAPGAILVVPLQTVTQGDPDLDVVEARAAWAHSVGAARGGHGAEGA